MSDGTALLEAQAERWERGDRTPVEALIAETPDLPEELVVDLIYHEIVLRERAGERPTLAEYVQRFPTRAAELRLQFEVHEAFDLDPTELPPPAEGGGARPAVRARTLPSIPGYDVRRPLGHGGMGIVFEARQQSLDRSVALKLLPPEAVRDNEALRRFQNEARAASSLNHPHICTIIDFGTHEEQPFLVMELVQGRTLAALSAEPPDVPRTTALARQIAEALAAAHDAGIVHRDIKPANVMVRDDGYVKVLDFGLARLMPTPGPDRGGYESRSGVVVGTPRYMSPEQLRGEQVGPASDVFSLGIVVYELLTGKHPFALDGRGVSLASALAAEAAKPSAENRDVPPALEALVLSMLEREPERRPTMAQVAAALALPSGERSGAELAAPPRRRAWRWRLGAALALILTLPALWLAKRGPDVPEVRGPTPSIVVLPFTTVGSQDSAYFGAGVTEDLTAMLTRTPEIAVLSNSAALAYKGAADVRDIGRELGVGYVLQGTVRKEEGKVRIVAQLVDARTGLDVWSERFDQTGSDPWALQDEIAGKILGALTGEFGQLKRAQYRAAWGADSTNLDEYDFYLRGHDFYMRLTEADNERAAEAWNQGLKAFPDSALLQAKLGFYHFMRPYLYFEDGAAADYAEAGRLARSALAKPQRSPLESRLAHWLFAYVSCQEGDYDRALRELEATIQLAPYDVFQEADLSTIRILAGEPEEAIRMNEKAMNADPANRAFYQQLRAWALCVAGRYEESEAALHESIELPAVPLLHAINLAHLGQADGARASVTKFLEKHPNMTLAKWRSANFYRDPSILDRQLTVLAAAGLP